MSPGKGFENEWEGAVEPKAGQPDAETICSDSDDDETGWLAEQRSHLRTMLSRAAWVYLVLFIGLGLIMSVWGVNPMVNNGLMPKVLLVFVGLALVIALANTRTDLSREQGRNWLRLVRGRAMSGKKPDE
jgi:hypothetical protein